MAFKNILAPISSCNTSYISNSSSHNFLSSHFTETGLLHLKLHLCISDQATTYHCSHTWAQLWDGTGHLEIVVCASELVILSTEDFFSTVEAATLWQNKLQAPPTQTHRHI